MVDVRLCVHPILFCIGTGQLVGVLLAIVQAGMLRIIIPKIGAERSVVIGLSLYTASLPLMAFAFEPWVLFAACIPYVFAGIAGPAIQGIISNRIPHTEQGQIQGGLTGVISLTAVIGPPVMTWLFAYFTRKDTIVYLPGAPFILAAVLTAASVVLAINHFNNYKNPDKGNHEELNKQHQNLGSEQLYR